VLLFIGDDWAEDHHDLELEDETGRRLAKARLPEGLEGITRLHALVAQHAPADWAELPSEDVAGRVIVGIETDRGPWVAAFAGGQLPGVRDQPVFIGAVSGAVLHLWRPVRASRPGLRVVPDAVSRPAAGGRGCAVGTTGRAFP